jgi:adenylate kinase family enzyme
MLASWSDSGNVCLLQHAVAQTPPGAVILLDGFPRSLQQAQQAEAALGRPLAVLYFDCSEATMKVSLSAPATSINYQHQLSASAISPKSLL